MITVPSTLSFIPPNLPSVCPVCGAVSLAPSASISMLLAVCDVLVIKALEAMGKFLVRTDRGRYTHMIASDIPMHLAHTIWTASDEIVSKATRGAWDVVPLILDTHGGCCEYDPTQVTNLLDGYVHDLVITGTPHDLDELEYRLRRRLNLPVYNHEQEAGSQ